MFAFVEKTLVAIWKMRLFEADDGRGVLFPFGPLFGFGVVDPRVGKVILRKLASHSALTAFLGVFAFWVGWQLEVGPVGMALIAIYDMTHGLLGAWRIVYRLPRLPMRLAVQAYVKSRGEPAFLTQSNQAFIFGAITIVMTPMILNPVMPIEIRAGFIVAVIWAAGAVGQVCVARWLWRETTC